MNHLGEKVAPLVDGQLPPEQAERASIHLAGCPRCREAVEVERRTKQQLAALGPVEPRGDFIRQLMQMAGPAGPLPPRPGHVPGTPRPGYVQTSPARVPALDTVSLHAEAPARPAPFAFSSSSAYGSLRAAPSEYSAEAAYRAYDEGALGAPALGLRERPPGRRGSVRPAGAGGAGARGRGQQRVVAASRASRTRLAVAMVGAACLVGAGVAGGAVSASGPSSGSSVSPAIATFVGGERVETTTTLPLSDTSLNYGTAGSRR